MARLKGTNLTAFDTVTSDLLSLIDSCEITIENTDEDASGAVDRFTDADVVKSSWTITADARIADSAELMAKALDTDPSVTISVDTGGNSYTGSALISTAGHSVGNGAHQRQKYTFKGQGTLSGVAPV